MICTRSKSLYPKLFWASGKYCWTREGEKYLDFTGSNLTVILGYSSPHMGWDFCPNLPGESCRQERVEKKLQEITKLKNYMFFKNGHNAVDCAVRLARHILAPHVPQANVYFYGYHGTGSEYVSTINHNGITSGQAEKAWQLKTQEDIENADPIDILVYESRYQKDAEKISAKFKICDHLKSGYFGLFEKTADLDCYGKSIANGYPVAVLAGNEHMDKLSKIYYSTTFGGDNLGLLAIEHTLEEAPKHYRKWQTLSKYVYNNIPCVATGETIDGILYSFRNDRITSERIKVAQEKGILIGQWFTIFPQHTPEDIDRLKEFCG